MGGNKHCLKISIYLMYIYDRDLISGGYGIYGRYGRYEHVRPRYPVDGLLDAKDISMGIHKFRGFQPHSTWLDWTGLGCDCVGLY